MKSEIQFQKEDWTIKHKLLIVIILIANSIICTTILIYTKLLKKNEINLTFSKALRVVSDFIHLMKRIRYRLLSNIIHAGFSEISNKIKLGEVKSVLSKLSKVVWSNVKFTKMHEKLPQALFTAVNLCALLKSNVFDAAYWFPVTMCNIALNTKDFGLLIVNFY